MHRLRLIIQSRMKEISSKDNRIIRQAASLSEKKYRDAFGMYLIEGPNFVRDAVLYGGRLRFIFIRAAAMSGEIMDIVSMASAEGPAVYSLTDEAFSKLSTTEHSQGIIAAAEKAECSEEEFFSDPAGDLLVLDRVQDPGNLGTMIRSAEAMGFSGVLIVKGSADLYGPKAVRAAAGSIFRLPAFFAGSPSEAADLLKKHGKKIYAAEMEAEKECFDADLACGAAIVIGNEGSGISAELLEAAEPIKIPMSGKIESLNAALAAGMMMYESQRQRLRGK